MYLDSSLFLYSLPSALQEEAGGGHGRDHLPLGLWHRGHEGRWVTPELKALTFPRHGHSLVGTRSAGSGNRPGGYGTSQIQSSCGCPVHTHPGLGGESRADKRVLVT